MEIRYGLDEAQRQRVAVLAKRAELTPFERGEVQAYLLHATGDDLATVQTIAAKPLRKAGR